MLCEIYLLQKKFDQKFGLNLFLLKKRDMPEDDSDFFDNVIEWKKVHNVRKKD